MAQFHTDLENISFNLFDVLKVQDHFPDYEVGDLKEIISEFNKFIAGEIYPTRTSSDEQGVRLDKDGVKVPECFKAPHKGYYENGWYGLGHPEEIGGIPAPNAVNVACTSIATGANVSFAMYFGLTRAAMNVILEIGSDEQKEKYIAPMMSGAYGGTMCLTEAGAGSDVGALKTTAHPLEDGSYKIKGTKIFISSGDNDLYENIIHLVLAKTPGASKGSKDLSLFIVPKFRINDDGSSGQSNDVLCSKVEEKMGLHAQATCELQFGASDDCVGNLIGKEFEGMANMFLMMNEARLLCGVQGEAQANLSYELTQAYCGERVQFGTEIKNLPDVKRMLLKNRAIARGLRALMLYTAYLFDLEKKDPSVSQEIALLTPLCKAYGSEMACLVANDMIQCHGGYGYCTEYGVEQFARDAKIATIYEGTTGIQAIDFVMRKILKDQGKTFGILAEKILAALKNPVAAQKWPEELGLLAKNMEKGQAILQKFGAMAKEKKFDPVLESASDFLMFSGALVTAWRLLENAIVAESELEGAQGARKEALKAASVDFQVFCRHVLVSNVAISTNILNFSWELSALEL